ncbi:LytTR family DNA-binding domain-containing protein [Gorillibacterium sp. sgz5001074]|uniref:LytTR family DNA-binding domain-containing protein n=1 Tax=Gorillibacterium sp. sgz5001074 TaxID=3446695 RepID=UPI003F673B1A
MRVLKPDGTPHEIREEEILYFSSYQNTLYVHTEEGEFIYPISLSELYAAYRPVGYERLDRSNVVNTRQVSEYDPERKAVMFRGSPGSYAPVSEPNERKIKKLLNDREREET